MEAIRYDSLRKIEKEEKRKAESTIMNAAKLIAPVIETSFAVGFDWYNDSYSDWTALLSIGV